MVATAVLPLVHVPEAEVLVSVAEEPRQTVKLPVIMPTVEGVYSVAVPGTVLWPLGWVLPL